MNRTFGPYLYLEYGTYLHRFLVNVFSKPPRHNLVTMGLDTMSLNHYCLLFSYRIHVCCGIQKFYASLTPPVYVLYNKMPYAIRCQVLRYHRKTIPFRPKKIRYAPMTPYSKSVAELSRRNVQCSLPTASLVVLVLRVFGGRE